MIKKVLVLALISSTLVSCKGEEENKTLAELLKNKTEYESKVKLYSDSVNLMKDKIKLLDTAIVGAKVRVKTVDEVPFSEIVKLQGTVEADKNVLVSPQSSGVIKGIFVKEGQRVSAGSTLASLDSDILNQNKKEIEKALELAVYVFDKQTKLKEQGVGTELQYEQAKNQKESLESKLKTLNTQTSKSRVSSPISGYVDKIIPNVGEMASPQMPMFRILNLNKVTITVDISENYLSEINNGKSVSIYFPSIDLKLDNLKITRTGKFINPANRTYTVQIDVDNKKGQILPNLLAEVSITKSFNSNAIVVPSKSVFEDSEGVKYVYVMVDNKAVKTIVNEDFVSGNNTQINSNSSLKKGDVIIIDGGSALVDGDLVEIL
mgnify:CR=1 FL=1